MKSKPKVAVVILCWNGKKFLEEFLPSVVRFTKEDAYQVVVADNASTDDSVKFVERQFPSVQIVKNEINNGFAGGYNEALKRIDAEYYVLLNQDVEVTENWIAPVIQLMDANPNIAAAQPKIRAFHQKTHFEYAGAAGGVMDRFGYPFCRGRIFYEVEEDLGQYDDVKEVFWATGASMFIRSERYHEMGGLDEDFFAHMEEIDLCWRLKNKGYQIFYCPDSIVYHVGGGSLPQGNPRKTYLNFRNNLIMLYKNLPATALFPIIFTRLILDGLAAVYSLLLERKPGDVSAIFRAHWNFFLNIPRWHKKRRVLQRDSAHRNTTGIMKMSIVWAFFGKGKKKYSNFE